MGFTIEHSGRYSDGRALCLERVVLLADRASPTSHGQVCSCVILAL